MKCCPDCGIEYANENRFCRECGKQLEGTPQTTGGRGPEAGIAGSAREGEVAPTKGVSRGKKKIVRNTTATFLLAGIVLFLLGFHIVNDVPLLVPKDHLTFTDTFITVKSYLDRYNNASLLERVKLSQSNLHRTLLRKGLIVMQSQEEGDADTTRTTAGVRNVEILSNRLYKTEYGSMHIVGELKNEGTRAATIVEVHARFYDAEGNIVGTEYAYSDPMSIPAGGTASFKIIVSEDEVIRATKRYRLSVEAH